MKTLLRVALLAVFALSAAATAEGKGGEKKEEAKEKREEAKEKKDEAKDKKEAKQAAATVGAPPMPVLPPEGKRWVESMLGKWKGTSEMAMGDQKMASQDKMECEKASGGWGAVCKMKFEVKGMPAQEATTLFGWDLATGEATMFEVTNMAEVHKHTGKWADEKNITVVHVGKNAEGKEEKDSLTLAWVSPKEVQVKAEGSVGGQTLWTMTGTMKK